MMPAPPPLVAQKSKKIPTWVWILTVVGVLMMFAIYGGMYWGYNKVQDFARTEIAKSNPAFELLYFTSNGKWKVRHKATGKEFSVDPPAGRGSIAVLPLATKTMAPASPWIKLKDVAPNAAKNGWDRMGDTGLLIEQLEDLFLDHEFQLEKRDDSTLTACNANLLQCVVIQFGFVEDQDNRSWYSAQFFTAP